MNSTDYEKLVQGLISDLISSDVVQPTDVRHLEVFTGRSGASYEIDLAYTIDVAGLRYLTLVECKYWNRRVGRNIVDGFRSVLDDIGAHKGIIVSTVGFQEGALIAAKSYGIGLMKVTDEQSGCFIVQRLSGPLQDIVRFLSDHAGRYSGGKFQDVAGIIHVNESARDIVTRCLGAEIADLVETPAEELVQNDRYHNLNNATKTKLRTITTEWARAIALAVQGGFSLYNTSDVDGRLLNHALAAGLILKLNGDNAGARGCCPWLFGDDDPVQTLLR